MREVRGDWRDLFNTFRMALDLRKLSLAFVGMVLSVAGIGVILAGTLVMSQHRDRRFSDEPGIIKEMRSGRWSKARERVVGFAGNIFELERGDLHRPRSRAEDRRGCLCPRAVALWRRCPLSNLGMPTRAGALMYALCGAWLLAVWSFFGGAITRIAAVELAKDERIEFNEATRFARAHRWSYVWSPLSVAAAGLVFALCIMAGGWVCDATWGWGVGKVLLALGFPAALFGGFLIVLLAIGGVLGCGMMFPAISAEGTDAFDAVSRAFSYVFSRPWRYLWYHVVALAYAIPSCLFVFLFSFGFIRLALRLTRAWMPQAAEAGRFDTLVAALPPALGGSLVPLPFSSGPVLWVAGCLFAALLYVLVGMTYAYVISFHCTAKTIIYFLMRKAVDGTEMKEVYEEESEEDLVAGSAAVPAAPAGEAPGA